MSGTIVERRDQVFTTFFSLRVLSASTFSRKWPSTNGPFLSERAIASLFLHAAQTAPLGVPHLLKSAHRARNTMRLRTKWANKPRAQSVRCAVHNHRPAGLAQLVEHRLERYDHFRHGLARQRGLGGRFPRQSFCCSLYRPCPASCIACSCCSHVSALPGRPCQRQPGTALLSAYLGRSRSGSRPVHFSAAGAERQPLKTLRPLPQRPFGLPAAPKLQSLAALDDHAIGALVLTR